MSENLTEIEAAAIAAHDRNIDLRLIFAALVAGKPVELPEGVTWQERNLLSKVDGKRHREGSPARQWKNGFDSGEQWLVAGKSHRNPHDGPSWRQHTKTGTEERWCVDGKWFEDQKSACVAWDARTP